MMMAVKKRYFMVTGKTSWLIFLTLFAGIWAGIFMLGFWVAGAFR